MSASITITWIVPIGYAKGDYARLYGNGGSGDIDYDTPLTTDKIELFPNGGGIYGWGQFPWGQAPWGCGWATRCPGWGQLPWGQSPWGYGTTIITVNYDGIVNCGEYKFALKIFDSLGNPNEGTIEELSETIHIAPEAPTGLTKTSYNSTSDILILAAA